MARNLSTPLVTALTAGNVSLCILAAITFASGPAYIWSGIGNLTWNGNTYVGVGSLGALGDIKEGTEVRAEGTSVTLSGIDTTLMGDAMNEIQIGAPATVYLGVFDTTAGALVDAFVAFAGTVDRPTLGIGGDQRSITLNLETRMYNFQRASNRRYTTPDQRVDYPDDPFFDSVEKLNDITLQWN